MRLVFLGPPGAGKGTYAKILAERERIPHISTGDILRAEMKASSALGKEARSFVESGRLVPDDLIVRMVRERLTKSDCAPGFILDGFPRTAAQAEALSGMLAQIRQALDVVIYFKAREETVVSRLSGRRVCNQCGSIYNIPNLPPKQDGLCDLCSSVLVIRKDDEPETVRARLRVYERETAPLIEYYRTSGLLREVSADLGVEKLDEEIGRLLEASGMR
jgi:adenylate kinase